ncbi:SH3 domain-binding protein 5 [Sabethes cyaneus]|uniref:SH3 domain-binding protein 5 n=1 Tax=Sabethes cyaneus TaxID=53552 RepID=UPI00237E2841|nr:SH3 domain-binding protein 5 [Sabethes cyaneus]
MSSLEQDCNAPVDPRVQIELEKLNEATDYINKYEVELDEARNEFRELLKESMEKIKLVAKKLGNSIETAKPYYEARLYASQLAKETQQSALNYDKAKSVHAAAKEMVFLAEQGLGEKSTLDTACQEMLTHATTRVNESQNECTEMRNLLRISELKLDVANNRVSKLHSQLKGAIRASSLDVRRNLLLMNLLVYQNELLFLPYYELRANYNALLLEHKQKVMDLEAKVSEAKMTYNEALTSLEKISEEIHQQRKARTNSIDEDASSSSSSTNHPRNPTVQKSGIGMHLPFCNSPSAARIECSDEYLEFPAKLGLKSSPIKQRYLDKLDCPHLLKDFARKTSPSGESDSDNNYLFSPNRTIDDITNMSSEDIEQWTEIRLSHSNSTSSEYSQHNSALDEDPGSLPQEVVSDSTETDSDDTNSGPRVKARIIKMEIYDDSTNQNTTNKRSEGIAGWITGRTIGRSASISIAGCSPVPRDLNEVTEPSSSSGRRQSLDIIIDTGDRMKDAFTQGIQRIGRTLERRNSESEIARDGDNLGGGGNGSSGTGGGVGSNGTGSNSGTGSDFFLFQRSSDTARDGLSDEQVENLLLGQDCSDLFQNVVNISK